MPIKTQGDSSTCVADTQRNFLSDLMNPSAYPHPVNKIRLIETHISYIFLTGLYAYKIKKAINLGFLDFTQLQQRQFFCEEELRLNSRLAPGLYLAVVPIGSSRDGGQIEGPAPAIDYAVKMTEFPQSALLEQYLAEGKFLPEQLDTLADRVAEFHGRVVCAGAKDDFGRPKTVWHPIKQSFSQLRNALMGVGKNNSQMQRLDELEVWCHKEFVRLTPTLNQRKLNGFVRECHGDMHLGNIIWLNGAPMIFDGIEFNAKMRWIDVMSDVAFLVMDLEERRYSAYAHRFLNRYLEATGDYAGLQVLSFYCVYRALVRAKVACLRAAQEEKDVRQAGLTASANYLAYAQRKSLPQKPWLVLMHGLSGSGKTTVAQQLLEDTGALRVRSDIERKRLCGVPVLSRNGVAVNGGIYDEETTEHTYLRLASLASQVLQAGFPVVVDAASLKLWQRDIFRRLAWEHHAPFNLISCRADEQTLRQRLRIRAQRGNDPSDADVAVLQDQQKNNDPLSKDEQEECWIFDGKESGLNRLVNALMGHTPPTEAVKS